MRVPERARLTEGHSRFPAWNIGQTREIGTEHAAILFGQFDFMVLFPIVHEHLKTVVNVRCT